MKKAYLLVPLVFAILLLIIPNVVISSLPIITVKTDSMSPTLNPGDKLVISRIYLEDVKPRDIIAFDTFSEEFGIITHRVIEIGSTQEKLVIQTKGDNNDHPDPWEIDHNSLIGIVSKPNPLLLSLTNDVIVFTLFAIVVISAILLGREFVRKKPNEN